MKEQRTNAITKLFADRKASRVAAPATPVVAPPPDSKHGPTMLFVQSFESGTIAPKEGSDDRYTVTLEHGLGQTLFFSDRPERVVGSATTGDFLKGIGFPDRNPPNAALLLETDGDSSEIAVVELFNPSYDPAGPTVTYDIAVLENWKSDADTGFTPAAIDLASLAPEFGTAHVFIDDCADGEIQCVGFASGQVVASLDNASHDGYCYSWNLSGCFPCAPWEDYSGRVIADYWSAVCNQLPECADGLCWAYNVCVSGLAAECTLSQEEYFDYYTGY